MRRPVAGSHAHERRLRARSGVRGFGHFHPGELRVFLSLLYISDSLLAPHERERELNDIVSVTRRNNGWLGLSGALIYSQTRFTQLLEGSENSVELMMSRIAADPRHANLRIVARDERVDRRLQGWKLAYSGRSLFVERAIEALAEEGLNPDDRAARVERLMALVVGLGRT
jgi:hypothetical protein